MDASKITIAVCGESFCAASNQDLKMGGMRGHFSQILQDHYGYRILPFAHGAFGNVGICFQIQEAITHGPQAIVYNQTWSSRISIPVAGDFDKRRGLDNFVYFDPHCPSTFEPYTGNLRSPILSTVPQGLEVHKMVSAEQLAAVKSYYAYLFSEALQQQTDTWLMEYWHRKIVDAGIVPIRFNDRDVGQIAYEFCEHTPNYDTPYHTDVATQRQIADNIHRKLVDILGTTK